MMQGLPVRKGFAGPTAGESHARLRSSGRPARRWNDESPTTGVRNETKRRVYDASCPLETKNAACPIDEPAPPNGGTPESRGKKTRGTTAYTCGGLVRYMWRACPPHNRSPKHTLFTCLLVVWAFRGLLWCLPLLVWVPERRTLSKPRKFQTSPRHGVFGPSREVVQKGGGGGHKYTKSCNNPSAAIIWQGEAIVSLAVTR